MDRKNKSPFCAATPAARSPAPPPAATPRWRRGLRPQRGLDKRLGMGEGSLAGVPLGRRSREGQLWTEGGI
jgi:hypothetical protein